MYMDLQIGDRIEDNSLIILDEDRLCYSVKSVSNGSVGVRTISKALLAEWVEAYKKTPNAPSQEVREKLVGKSDIDRFEYGYAGTLAKMAKMILGQLPVVHASSGQNYENEFITWWSKVAKRAEKTAQNYLGYLACLNKPLGEKTHSTWPGIFIFLFGCKSEREVGEVGTLADFDRIFGPFCRIFDKSGCPKGASQEAYEECVQWVDDVSEWGCLSSAFKAYREFLKWREEQNKAKDETFLANADRLSVALKLFEAKRGEKREGGGESHDWHCERARELGRRIDGDYLVTCDYDAFRNTLNARQVANTFFSKHTDDDKRRLGDFIAAVRQDPRDISFYLAPGNQPNVPGVGPAMLTAFLTRTRPDLFVFFTEQMFESVKFLGLTAEDALPALSTDAYNTYRGIQTAIRDRMREMGIKAENGNDADYLTVNEFTWFVSENKDLIKEKIMTKTFKNASKKPKGGSKKLSDALKDPLLQRLAAALRTKPFAILAGHSGTGKSQMVRKLAYMTCADEGLMDEAATSNAPGNYCMIQVRPNWHDSTDLLGYYSELREKYRTTPFVQFVCKAYAYPEIPFFVCLDEMNLAPVEQYFAEYLSAIESMTEKNGQFLTDPLIPGKYAADDIMEDDAIRFTESKAWYEAHGLTLPKNLFVVGTVNMDDTTCQFSRKVLDRAMTIMMDKVDFKDMQDATKSAPPSKDDLLEEADIKKFREGKLRADPLSDGQVALLNSIDEVLRKTPFAVAYRYANEYALYEDSLAALTGKPKDGALDTAAMDHCVLMKVLPRIHGVDRAVERIFKGNDSQGEKGLMSILASPDTLSGAKMQEILDRKQTYLSFWP